MTREENAHWRSPFVGESMKLAGWGEEAFDSLRFGVGGLSLDNITPSGGDASFIIGQDLHSNRKRSNLRIEDRAISKKHA